MNLLDLRGIPCPQNSAKALIFLATIDTDELVTFYVDHGEPIDNVPPSLENEGHTLIKVERTDSGHWIVVVKAA